MLWGGKKEKVLDVIAIAMIMARWVFQVIFVITLYIVGVVVYLVCYIPLRVIRLFRRFRRD